MTVVMSGGAVQAPSREQVVGGAAVGGLGGCGSRGAPTWYSLDMSRSGLDAYKIVLYRQDDGSWVAEVPAISGCYALMATREEALAELSHVFNMIAEEYQERGDRLPEDTTEIVNA